MTKKRKLPQTGGQYERTDNGEVIKAGQKPAAAPGKHKKSEKE